MRAVALLLAAVTALWACYAAQMNGWLRRYLWCMAWGVAIQEGSLALWPAKYETAVAIGLVPVLVSGLALSYRWIVGAPTKVRYWALWFSLSTAVLTFIWQFSQSLSIWGHFPEALAPTIAAACYLLSAGILALSAVPFMDGEMKHVAAALGRMWVVLGVAYVLYPTGVAYYRTAWLEISDWLFAAIVVYGLLAAAKHMLLFRVLAEVKR